MIHWWFPAFTLLSVVLVGLCGVHAYPDRRKLAMLSSGVVYGLLLEQLTMLAFDPYYYPTDAYVAVVADVPVAIGLTWGALLYAGYRTARRGGLSGLGVPVFVALFLLHVDLAIDAVAIRAGYWFWKGGGGWFGVPLGNFVGWYWVAFCFACVWVVIDERFDDLAEPVAAVGGVVASTLGLLAVLFVHDGLLWPALGGIVPIAATVAISAVGLLHLDWQRHAVPWPLAAVPLLVHAFFLVLVVLFALPLSLLALGVAMLAVDLLVHAPLLERWQSRVTTRLRQTA